MVSSKQDSKSDKKDGQSERGFAFMDSEHQQKIASEGAKAVHRSANAHEFTSEKAHEAERKEGQSGTGSGKRQVAP